MRCTGNSTTGCCPKIERVTASLSPGRERLLVSATTYLDGCLRDRGVRALLLEARADPVIAGEIGARNASTAKVVRADFKAMGWAQPLECAQLWVGMTAEAALLELKAGRRSPAVRTALASLHPRRVSAGAVNRRRRAET